MKKCDIKLLAGLGGIYLAITLLSVWSSIALFSLGIAIVIVAAGLAVYCEDRNCVFV